MEGNISVGMIKQVISKSQNITSYIEQRLNLNTGFLIKSVISNAKDA